MKSKTEKKLDEEFEKLGIKTRVYHFINIPLFNAVTVVTPDNRTYGDIKNIVLKSRQPEFYLRQHAEYLLSKLAGLPDLHGVAICDIRDQFDRKLGRIIAKGRLLKQLKKEREEFDG